MNKKKTREELAEFKNGKYMGGPAEERAEKKKMKKRMAAGGIAGAPAGKMRGGMEDGEMGRPAGVGKPAGAGNGNAAMGGGRGTGLPPGLAKRGPGNLPPGLAKRASLPYGLGGTRPAGAMADADESADGLEKAKGRFDRAKNDMTARVKKAKIDAVDKAKTAPIATTMAEGGVAGAPLNAGQGRGIGSQVRALAQAPNRTGGIGEQVRALAQRNTAAPAAKTMKSGGMVRRGNGAAIRGITKGKIC